MAEPMDWPTWRGPEQNGISREKNLPDSWNPKGETLLWSNEKLASRSTPILMDGKLFLICNDNPASLREGEKVVCADANTGEIVWENKFNVYLSDVPDTRVGWSSVVGDPLTGDVFVLGVCGIFRRINGATGETVWEHSLSEEYGLLSTYGGRTNFPIVYEDLVIISAVQIGWGDLAKPAHRFIAFDKRNGQPVWLEGTRLLPTDTTYSTPIVATLNGQTAIVFGSGDGGVHAMQLRTGKKLWSYYASARGINTTPLVTDEGIVICGHSEENLDSTTLGALFALDGNATGDIKPGEELWRTQGLTVGKTAPLLVDGRIYAVGDYGHLWVVDAKTGETIQTLKIGTQGRASPLYADGKIYACDAAGRCHIYRPVEKGVEVVETVRLTNVEILASPVVSHGKLFLTTTKQVYCFGKKDAPPAVDNRPEVKLETDDKEAGAAHLQLVPVEALLKPGQDQQFQVRLYSKNGLYIRTVPVDQVKFTLDGGGAISTTGLYSTPDASGDPFASIVTATFGELTAKSRVRVVPELPWKFDFSEGEVPINWVGIRYRNVTVDFDFLQRLEQETPLAAKLYIYLQSEFVNNATANVSYDNSTPRQLLAAMYIYLGIRDEVSGLEDAKRLLNEGLDKLVSEKFLTSYAWDDVAGKGPTFKAVKGDRQDGDNIVMMKITTIPLGTRSQGWMGHPGFSKYTIQADVRGAGTAQELGDVGVIGQRYRLELLGARQQLQLYSWVSHEIKYKAVDFPWSPNVWYTMKLRTDFEERDGNTIAILKGKVWPRDDAEPEAWTIEWEDEPANVIGSPGLVGSAKTAELFYDNILVTPNE